MMEGMKWVSRGCEDACTSHLYVINERKCLFLTMQVGSGCGVGAACVNQECDH